MPTWPDPAPGYVLWRPAVMLHLALKKCLAAGKASQGRYTPQKSKNVDGAENSSEQSPY